MYYTELQRATFDTIAACVRALTLEAIETAQSGHPGLPLGCAELGTLLYSELLRHDPARPDWMDRDRFVLSGGHGSMLLYALLHLSGYDISLDDIRRFRAWGSKCPGHPEHGVTPGVEMTTGPLGQGLASAVGMAIAQKQDQARWGVFNNRTIVLAGDGDMMEGVVHEAVSLAGMQQLDNLIVLYDSNRFTIDGTTDITFTEQVGMTFSACGWHVSKCSGYDYEAITSAYAKAHDRVGSPSLIIVETIIGKGAPHFEDQAKAHCITMGQAEIDLIREQAGLPAEPFTLPQQVYDHFAAKRAEWALEQERWRQTHSDTIAEIEGQVLACDPDYVRSLSSSVPVGALVESRTTFSQLFQQLHSDNPQFIGGTADLSSPCLKSMTTFDLFTPDNRTGNFINFGVREHAMAAIANGIQLYQLRDVVYCATFLSFVDYLRPALRMSALMELPVIYLLAYDSIYNGEDGPTHQPVEQLPALRCMPNIRVIRPADAQEGAVCAGMAVSKSHQGPVVCLTTRQKLTCFAKYDADWQLHMELYGAYIVKREVDALQLTVVATGSEVYTVLRAVEGLTCGGLVMSGCVRVVSMPCRELFYELALYSS